MIETKMKSVQKRGAKLFGFPEPKCHKFPGKPCSFSPSLSCSCLIFKTLPNLKFIINLKFAELCTLIAKMKHLKTESFLESSLFETT